jgi:hypothetical protein
MTDPLDHAPEPDDRPATMAAAAATPEPSPVPAVPAARVPYRPRPSAWGRLFRWWLGLSLLTFVGLALCVAVGIDHSHLSPLNITITDDGADSVTINGLTDGGRALLAVAGGLLALLLLLLIPLLVLLIIGSIAIALVCGVGVPLIALALVLGVVTSPFWLVALFVWLAARRRDTNRLAASATMPA